MLTAAQIIRFFVTGFPVLGAIICLLIAALFTGIGWYLALRPDGLNGGMSLGLGFMFAVLGGMFLCSAIDKD